MTTLAYFEWSAPDDADLDDPEALRQANPAFGIRITEEFARVERDAMDDDEFARERLGIFPEVDDAPEWAVVAEDVWRSVLDTGSDDGWLSGPLSLAIEMATRRDRTSIVLAGERRGGGAGAVVAAVDEGPPSWVVDEVLSIRAAAADRGAPVVRVVIDPRSPAGSLIEDLRAAGVEVTEIPTSELVRATGAMLDRLPEVRVRSTPELDDAVSVAQLRRAGEAHVIDRWSKHDASPFIALDLALWGHAQGEPESDVSVYEERGLVTL